MVFILKRMKKEEERGEGGGRTGRGGGGGEKQQQMGMGMIVFIQTGHKQPLESEFTSEDKPAAGMTRPPPS